MSQENDLIPVDQKDLVVGQPLIYDIYDKFGQLLIRKGEIFSESRRRDLITEGWRQPPIESSHRPPAHPLPAPQARPTQAPLEKHSVVRQPLDQAKVLVVEDMKLSQKLLANILNQQRVFNIETADDGRSALKKFKAHRYDLVFLDIDMPVMDGLSALAEIKAIDPTTFTCFVSGSSTLANVLKAKELRVDAFIAKPINASRIEHVLKMYAKNCKKTR